MANRVENIAYSVMQLSECGCGDDSGIRKRSSRVGIPYIYRNIAGNKAKHFQFKDLPADWQSKIERYEAEQVLKANGIDQDALISPATVEETALQYSKAPDYNRRKFDKYAKLLKEFELYDGCELREKIGKWNQKYPSRKTSYPSIMRARKAVKEKGASALVGVWGKRQGQSKINPLHLERFKELYLKEGCPSANSCWATVAGEFCVAGDISDFPSVDTFLRQTCKEVGESAIYRVRHGFNKWNRKYASYIDRDYSALKAGECWVSDHAQIDVMVTDPANGKPVCGWITSFMDMKTGKTLSIFYHTEAPNSDHIFQAFFMAAESYGLPEYVYIDNGKDYRCRDFAGGNKVHKVSFDESRAASMLAVIGVTPIFSIPYNAQSKNVERMHLKIKQGLSSHMPGYRGGNVVERPEKLAKEIKAGQILDFVEFRDHLYDWTENVMNKMPSNGKVLQGKSPDDQWNLENPDKRTVSRDALRLFCMRTSRPLTIGRNGVKDSVLGVTYWAEWMVREKGRKVYLRRPVEDFNECWIFVAENDAYLGNATIAGTVPAIAKDEIGKQKLKEAMASKRREQKTVKALGLIKHSPDVADIINNQKAAAELLNKAKVDAPSQTVSRISRTRMDDTVNQRRNESGVTPCPSTARIAAELDNAKRELAYWTGYLIKLPSEREDKERNIDHWRQEMERLQVEWNAVKVTPLLENTLEKSEPDGVDSRRAQSGR